MDEFEFRNQLRVLESHIVRLGQLAKDAIIAWEKAEQRFLSYGRHSVGCDVNDQGSWKATPACTCGFEEALGEMMKAGQLLG